MRKLLSILCGLSVAFSTTYAVETVVVDALTRHVLNTGVINFGANQLQVNGVVVSGGGGGGVGGGVNSISLSLPVIFATPLTFTNDGAANWSATAVLATQPAFTFFGNGTAATDEPTFMDAATAKTALGLNLVDNTSDLSKPISTAQGSVNTSLTSSIAGNTSAIGTINTTLSGLTLATIAAPAGDVSLAGFKITNLGTPVSPTDGANKSYVDTAANVGPPHPAVATASTGNLTLSGEQTIDGVLTSTSRVLVKDQTTASQNGIYVSAAGAWTRAADANTGTSVSGTVFVSAGTTQTATSWGVSTPQPITLNTTAISYTLTGTGGTTYTGGSGVALVGNQFRLATIATGNVLGNNSGSTAIPTVQPATTVGFNLLGLANPSAVTFPRINADNTVTARSAANFLSDIGAGSVTSVDASGTNAASDVFTYSFSATTTAPRLSVAKPNAAALTFYGNSSGSSAAPTFMSAATARTTLGGTTVGQNLFTLANPGAYTYPRLNNDNTVTALSASAVRTDIGAGQIDSAVPLANSGTSAAPSTWSAPATATVETVELTSSDRVVTLPPASSYPPGRRIIYTDNVTRGNFGRFLRRNGTDTLNGGTADFRPFIAGATGVFGGKSAEFENINQTGWQVVTTASVLSSLQDPTDASKVVTFDLSSQPPGQTPPFKLKPASTADSVSVVPTNLSALGVITNINSDGTANKNQQFPRDLLPQIDQIGTPGTTFAGGTYTVDPSGVKDTIDLAGTLTVPLTVTLPPAGAYFPGTKLFFVDSSGSVSSVNSVTLTPLGTDTINFGATIPPFTEANGVKVLKTDGVSNWSVAPEKSVLAPGFQTLTAASGVFTLNPNQSLEGQQKAYMVLGNGANALSIPSPFDGMQVYLTLVQPASGAAGTLSLPVGSAVTSTGAGVVTLSTANGSIDTLEGTYNATLAEWLWKQPAKDYTSAALPAAPSALATGTVTSTTIPLTWTDNATNETQFDLERSIDTGSTYTTRATLSPNTTSYTDTSLTPATTYYYKIRAQNSGGSSAFTTAVNATTTSACSAGGDLFQPASTTGSSFGTANTQWFAAKFTATTGNTAICAIDVALFWSGASLGSGYTVTAYIYSDNGGSPSVPSLAPGGIVSGGTSTNTITSAQLFSVGSTAAAGIASPSHFTFSGVSLTANNTYWIVLKTSTTDATGKHPNWASGTKSGGANSKSADPTASWTSNSTTINNWFKTWH